MPNSLTVTPNLYEKNDKIAHYVILIVFLLALLNSIRNIEVESVFPFMPIALLGVLTGCTSLLLLTKRISIKSLKTPLFIGINCFGILIFFSTIYSKYPQLTTTRSLQFILVTNCLYLMLSNVQDLKRLFEEVAKITILFTLIASAYGIIIYKLGSFHLTKGIWITRIYLFDVDFDQIMHGERISSFVGNPNFLGIFLMYSILACIFFMKNKNSIWYVILILFFFYALLLTGSRASMIGVIAGGLFFINYTYFKNTLATTAIRILIIGIVIIISGYLFLSPELIKSLFSLMGRESNTLSGREVAWAALIEQIKETPFLGVGYKISAEGILEKNKIPVSHSHNLYLSILSEVGIIGLITFFYILPWPIFYLFIRKKNITSTQSIITSILLSFLINQLFEDMFAPLSYFFIWFFFILYLLIPSIQKPQIRNK